MKNKIYYFGIICFLLLYVGAMFKMMHWPGAGIVFTLSFGLFSLVFFPVAMANSYKAVKEKNQGILYILAFVSILVVCAGTLFKIMHWPGSSKLMIIAVPLPFVLFLPAYLIFINKSKQINYTNLIFVLFFFAYYGVITVFLSLNVSKDAITESIVASNHLEEKAFILNKQTDMMIIQASTTVEDSIKFMNIQKQRNELINLIDNLESEITKLLESGSTQNLIQNKDLNWWNIKEKDITFSIRQIFDNDITTLQNKITQYKEQLLFIIPENQKDSNTHIQQLMKTNEDEWNGRKNIFNQPIVFVIQALHQIKRDISIATYEATSALEEKNSI